MRYLLQMEGSSTSLCWEFPFEATSDYMAMDLAKSWLKYDPAIRTAMAIGLFNLDKDERVVSWDVKMQKLQLVERGGPE